MLLTANPDDSFWRETMTMVEQRDIRLEIRYSALTRLMKGKIWIGDAATEPARVGGEQGICSGTSPYLGTQLFEIGFKYGEVRVTSHALTAGTNQKLKPDLCDHIPTPRLRTRFLPNEVSLLTLHRSLLIFVNTENAKGQKQVPQSFFPLPKARLSKPWVTSNGD